jgi:hypothetical protein
MGTIHAEGRACAASSMTAASMPNGNEKNKVESSAASTTTPTGEAHRATSEWDKARMRSRRR